MIADSCVLHESSAYMTENYDLELHILHGPWLEITLCTPNAGILLNGLLVGLPQSSAAPVEHSNCQVPSHLTNGYFHQSHAGSQAASSQAAPQHHTSPVQAPFANGHPARHASSAPLHQSSQHPSMAHLAYNGQSHPHLASSRTSQDVKPLLCNGMLPSNPSLHPGAKWPFAGASHGQATGQGQQPQSMQQGSTSRAPGLLQMLPWQLQQHSASPYAHLQRQQQQSSSTQQGTPQHGQAQSPGQHPSRPGVQQQQGPHIKQESGGLQQSACLPTNRAWQLPQPQAGMQPGQPSWQQPQSMTGAHGSQPQPQHLSQHPHSLEALQNGNPRPQWSSCQQAAQQQQSSMMQQSAQPMQNGTGLLQQGMAKEEPQNKSPTKAGEHQQKHLRPAA